MFLANTALVVVSILVVLVGTELVLRYVWIKSDAFTASLNSLNWFHKYWKPINSHGFRDEEHTAASLKGKKTVFVVGDSFVAGHGIENASDRFSDVLKVRLGADWSVMNVAKNGWNTAHEVEALFNAPFKPDVVVLAYYLNDIEGAAFRSGYGDELVEEINDIKNRNDCWFRLSRLSYLADFIYWRVFRITQLSDQHWNKLMSFYQDPVVWRAHVQELGAVLTYTRMKGSRLVVVLFPNLLIIKGSREPLEKVGTYYRAQGVQVINLADELAAVPLKKRIVSSFDPHPGVYAHQRVGELLYQIISSPGY